MENEGQELPFNETAVVSDNEDRKLQGLIKSIPGLHGDGVPGFKMPSKKEFPLFGRPEMKTKDAKRFWKVYTSTRKAWFPFELYRLGELVYYEVKCVQLYKEMYKQGGEVWYVGEEDEPVESPFMKIIDKFAARRHKMLVDLALTRSQMHREKFLFNKKLADEKGNVRPGKGSTLTTGDDVGNVEGEDLGSLIPR